MADNNSGSNGVLIAIVVILVGVLVVGAVWLMNGSEGGSDIQVDVPDTINIEGSES